MRPSGEAEGRLRVLMQLCGIADIVIIYVWYHHRYRAPEWREGRLCVLMELCDGGCVDSLLQHYGALRWNIVSR
jgi:hypothetical protein